MGKKKSRALLNYKQLTLFIEVNKSSLLFSLTLFFISLVNGSHEYMTSSVCASTEQVSHSSTTPSLIPSHTRNEVVDSAIIHDYDLPHELNFVPFRQSGENIGTLDNEKQYTTMISSVRPNTPSTISNASERSHYSQPRPINRYQSPATNQRYYDSPRCVHSPAISSNSEYDDPAVLDRTVS